MIFPQKTLESSLLSKHKTPKKHSANHLELKSIYKSAPKYTKEITLSQNVFKIPTRFGCTNSADQANSAPSAHFDFPRNQISEARYPQTCSGSFSQILLRKIGHLQQSVIPVIPDQDLIIKKKYGKILWKKTHQIVELTKCEGKLINIRHRNFLPIKGQIQILDTQGSEEFVPKNSKLYFITQSYSKNTLRALLTQFGSLSEKIVRRYIQDIMAVVTELNNRELDIGPLTMEMLVCNSQGVIQVNTLKALNKTQQTQDKVSRPYLYPPESLLAEMDAQKLLVWSVGCIMLELKSNVALAVNPQHPYNQRSFADISDSLQSIKEKYLHQSTKDTQEQLTTSLFGDTQSWNRSGCLLRLTISLKAAFSQKYKNRPSILDLSGHPFIFQ